MDGLFGDIYKGKTVLITGHTGFKGSWLALWLIQLGANVVGYSVDIPTQPNHFELLKLEMTSILGDILDCNKLESVIETHKPDIIFHLAAQPLVRKSYLEPVSTFETNIMGTINTLECVRKTKTTAIVNITSDKCYENDERNYGYIEGDPLGGSDPYSASKGAAEIVSNSYRRSFFSLEQYGKSHQTLLANVRAGNVIGGGDWAQDRLIPDLVRDTSSHKTVMIRNPQATRPWQHVLEPLSGYLNIGWKLLVQEVKFSDNWNFGPSQESNLTVGQIVKKAKQFWPEINYEIQEDQNNFHEANLLMLDSSKAQKELNWKGVWNINQTFERTINWYKEYYQSNLVISQKDLEDYIESARKIGLDWTKA